MNTLRINEAIVNKLNELGLTVSTCESMTGGAVGSSLVLVDNASKCFLGSFSTYSTNSKLKFAKVRDDTISEYGTVSLECAIEMAQGCQKAFNSDIGISITGNAGANPVENKPTGLAFISICFFDKTYNYQFISTYKNRVDIINECVAFTLNKLWDIIKDLKK